MKRGSGFPYVFFTRPAFFGGVSGVLFSCPMWGSGFCVRADGWSIPTGSGRRTPPHVLYTADMHRCTRMVRDTRQELAPYIEHGGG